MAREADSSIYMVAMAILLAGIMSAGLLGINATADWSLSPTAQIRPLTFAGSAGLSGHPVRLRAALGPAGEESAGKAPARSSSRLPGLPGAIVATSIQPAPSAPAVLSTFASNPAETAAPSLKVSGKATDAADQKGGKESGQAQALAAQIPGRNKNENGQTSPGENSSKQQSKPDSGNKSSKNKA